jgi:hypothetical protein
MISRVLEGNRGEGSVNLSHQFQVGVWLLGEEVPGLSMGLTGTHDEHSFVWLQIVVDATLCDLRFHQRNFLDTCDMKFDRGHELNRSITHKTIIMK